MRAASSAEFSAVLATLAASLRCPRPCCAVALAPDLTRHESATYLGGGCLCSNLAAYTPPCRALLRHTLVCGMTAAMVSGHAVAKGPPLGMPVIAALRHCQSVQHHARHQGRNTEGQHDAASGTNVSKRNGLCDPPREDMPRYLNSTSEVIPAQNHAHMCMCSKTYEGEAALYT